MANYTFSATGGAAAGYKAIIRITQGGIYKIKIGKGGYGYGAEKGGSPSGEDGTESRFLNSAEGTMLYVGPGSHGSSGPVWAVQGTGGGVVKDQTLNEVYVYVEKSPGNNGSAYAGGGSPSLGGAEGPISGHTWGASGGTAAGYAGGRVSSSYHGYAKLVFKGVNDYEVGGNN